MAADLGAGHADVWRLEPAERAHRGRDPSGRHVTDVIVGSMEVLSAVEARLRVHMRTCILYQVHVLRVMCYVHVRVCSAAVEARLLRRLATGHSVGARRNEEERRLEAERRVGRHLRSVLLEQLVIIVGAQVQPHAPQLALARRDRVAEGRVERAVERRLVERRLHLGAAHAAHDGEDVPRRWCARRIAQYLRHGRLGWHALTSWVLIAAPRLVRLTEARHVARLPFAEFGTTKHAARVTEPAESFNTVT